MTARGNGAGSTAVEPGRPRGAMSARRRRALAVGGVLAGLGMTGCAVGGARDSAAAVAPPPPQGGPPVEVVFMRTANASLARAYEAQTAAFNAKGGPVTGRFEAAAVAQNESWLAKLTTMLATDTAPDCFLLPQDILPSVASTGSLLTLDPYLRRDAKEVDTADFFPSHLAGGKWRNQQVALTPDGCAILEYYNVTLFREAGVPTPTERWTWPDYLDAARRLTKKVDGQITQAGIDNPFNERHLLPWLWSNGTDLFTPDFKSVRIAEPAAQAAVQFAVDLVGRHGVTTISPGAALGVDAAPAGRAAMWRANRGMFGQLANVTSFTFNVVPIPRAPQTGQSVTFTGPGHIGIARNNKRPDAAWEWLKFLTGTEAQIIRSKSQQGGCPSRKSATQDPSYRDTTIPALETPEANKTFSDVLANPNTARFVPHYVAMDEAIDLLSKHVAAAIQGSVSVTSALQSASADLEDLLRRKPQPSP